MRPFRDRSSFFTARRSCGKIILIDNETVRRGSLSLFRYKTQRVRRITSAMPDHDVKIAYLLKYSTEYEPGYPGERGVNMVSSEFKTTVGIHTYVAANLARTATAYRSDIRLSYNGNEAVAKSLLGILALGVGPGAAVTVTADGPDENAAVEALSKLLTAAPQG